MKNSAGWHPTKFELKNGKLKASRDPQMGVGSRLIGDILAREYQEVISKYARGTLVDLGCGKVPLYECYKDLVSEVICIDWQGAQHKNLYLDYECDLNTGIPLADASCDTILATDLVEHISNPERLWSNMSRILKKDGILILGSPFLYSLHEEPYDFFRYTEFKLQSLCDTNKLKVLRLAPYGGSPEVILDMIAKHLKFSRLLARIHVLLSGIFIRSRLGRHISAITCREFPLGYILIAQKS